MLGSAFVHARAAIVLECRFYYLSFVVCVHSLGRNFIVTSGVISTFSPVIFNTLIEHVYSSGVTRQFLINIPDLASSDLTPILIYSHMIFICNRSRYRFAAGDQCYFPVRVKFQSYPVNWQIIFLIAFNFVLL